MQVPMSQGMVVAAVSELATPRKTGCMARVDYLVGEIGIQAHTGRQSHRHVGGNACTEWATLNCKPLVPSMKECSPFLP